MRYRPRWPDADRCRKRVADTEIDRCSYVSYVSQQSIPNTAHAQILRFRTTAVADRRDVDHSGHRRPSLVLRVWFEMTVAVTAICCGGTPVS